MINSKRSRLRIIIPAYPSFNVYSNTASSTTALGPVYIATAANKLPAWDVEIIDENNCKNRFCPKDNNGFPDHRQLQEEQPACVVGFYCSLTCTMPRVFELAQFYKNAGAVTIAGGKHTENMPGEALANNIDYVVLREGELVIPCLLNAIQAEQPVEDVKGICFLKNNVLITTQEQPLITDFDLLPQPDFSLVRFAKILIYPVDRIRGCNMNCEFCSVKENVRCAKPQRVMNQITQLVETRKARQFFDVSDHFAANRRAAIEFCKLFALYQEKNNVRLRLTVQIRLSDAGDTDLMAAMKLAGIYMVCIGYESPIDEELKIMKKGYSSKEMLAWTKILHKNGFFIHGMFIFGYPAKDSVQLPVSGKVKRFISFLNKAKIDTLQVLLPIPLPGTALRKRLDDEGRIYDKQEIGWEYYDAQFPLFEPDNNEDPLELQKAVRKIMRQFYHLRSFFRLVFHIVIHFPVVMFASGFSLFTFRIRYMVRTFLNWRKKYYRNNVIRFGGYFIIKNWSKAFKADNFIHKLARARARRKPPG